MRARSIALIALLALALGATAAYADDSGRHRTPPSFPTSGVAPAQPAQIQPEATPAPTAEPSGAGEHAGQAQGDDEEDEDDGAEDEGEGD